MGEQRSRIRIDCEDQCQLTLEDSFYFAKVKNISLIGALIHFDGQLPNVRVGGNCKVSLFNSLFEYDCKVLRVDTPNIAVKFNNLY